MALSAAVFAAAAALGLGAAAPAVSVGDSGEFAAAAATLGVPHAPGYPLYVLLARAFGEALPWGSWAWRLNLLSGLLAAAALAVFAAACRRRGASPCAAAAGAAFLGLSPLWLHTNAQAEVFALNALLAAACLWVVAGPRPTGARAAAALGLLLGLGTGNHHTLALAVPALAASAWLAGRPGPAGAARFAGTLALFALLGATVQLVLPLRSAAHPPLDWGHPADLRSFLHVFLRRDYGSFSLTVEGAAASGGAARQALRWAAELWSGFGALGTLLAAAGLAALASLPGRRRDAVLAGGLALGAGPFFLALGDPPFDAQTSYALQRFWLLSWLGAAAAAVAAVHALGERLGRLRPALWALVLVPAASAWRAAPAWAQRWDLAAHDHGRNLLRSLPPGSALALDGGDDNFYPLAAALYADGRRPDARVFDRGGLVFPSPYGPDFRALPKDAKEPRRLAVEGALARERPFFYATLRREHPPWGLLRRPGPPSPAGAALWEVYSLRLSPALERAHFRLRALTPFYPVMRAAAADAEAALRLLAAALAIGPDPAWVPVAVAEAAQWLGWSAMGSGRPDAAARAYALAERAAPGDPGALTNLGAALEAAGRRDEARAAYARAASLSPEDPRPRYNMGVLLYKAGDFAGAEAEFAAAAARPGADPEAALWAARARARRR